MEMEQSHFGECHTSASTNTLSQSPPSSSLSSSASSSYSSSSFDGGIFPRGEAESSKDQWLRFFGIKGNGEWNDIQKRFEYLSMASNGSQQALKCSDFASCIGMQECAEFGNEVLRALRGSRKDPKEADITREELYSHWIRLTNPSTDSAITIFFDLFDRDMDGKITENDIKQIILLSASTNKLSLAHEEAENYSSLVMEYLDSENRGYIEINQFETLFRISLSKGSLSTKKPQRISDDSYPLRDEQILEGNSKAEILFREYWRRTWIVLLWLVLCAVLFAWKFFQYRRRTAFEVMGYCLSTAKGAAETLKLNMALILLPVCRNTITWIRRNPRISSVIPFNDNINFHKLIAGAIVVGVILHGGTHLACDFPRISGSNSMTFQQTIAPGFGFRQPSYLEILATTEVATGIAMSALMAVAFLLATKWARRHSPGLPLSIRHVTGYNTFWYSHHLFIPVYALLLIHSMLLFFTDSLAQKTTWMYIAIPVIIYTGERVLRAVRSGSCEVRILQVSFYPGKVVSLKLQKPEGFKYQSGMYILIQCPQISPLEWHPFSLTSGPEDDYVSVHVRTLGDWSYKIYGLFQEASLSGAKEFPKIYIDGPYGSASQDHVKYDVILLIGLGIGATPFISILKDVIDGVGRSQINDHNFHGLRKGPVKAYLYWVTREQSSFDWFRDVMKEISESDQRQSVVEVHNFLTSVYEEGDVRSALISAVQTLHHAKHGTDIVSQTPVRTHFARPNWVSIFWKLAWRHRGARIGVFYCGASGLGKDLQRMCTLFSTKTTSRFVFHNEHY